ncbi:MarR family transcriptional regulator [Shewanella sp. 1_MG-2023]|jgi:DNA-binding MarR family transcriptional regulator|uniref:MarR family transcriptional regulator n=1 Tax=Shewanella electrodiphila TaxID=934143 RepID=A0ABT0KRK8_9GAMM|nr:MULTISPECIES: MarR family transcriptional regulator [Shewanella]MCC4833104.1 MarR family transcriptional regulator [Shewanella sp. 10N.7]MCL1046244.1 MarR family transcriptional regulator [Shewanella electrodiphila]MDO6613552.1 MarR family transcriptional regulator [Shewanella sp. 7_MG-2023]MDO6773382.1 MarR family transcriptional regulator [Shewanella sp. 2_MG-2023]MDO6796033.1 MarR family transcriptional regulator [Shewanella sp. 1_MG-2023]
MQDRKSLESLFQLVHGLKRQLHNNIEKLNLDMAPMNVRVLKVINKKIPCTAIDIAQFLNRDKAQVTRLLNGLIAQELIVKEPNPEDKRSQCLRLTEKSQLIMEDIALIDKKIHEQMTNGITEEELALFENIAAKMAENLSSNP